MYESHVGCASTHYEDLGIFAAPAFPGEELQRLERSPAVGDQGAGLEGSFLVFVVALLEAWGVLRKAADKLPGSRTQ